ncbi:TspO/MBR-related protein [Collybia nuda]|uniref:TspO/MBR-related protein n=1 Tax=Collybia nuda TaxID=64659 RepID=A0A9P6CL78_9AGAR|nr:TspO/MBR-related protein [Collybia nuda]
MPSSPSGSIFLPSILLAIPRNPVTALGLPLALGSLNAFKTTSFVRADWFQNLTMPPFRPPREIVPFAWSILFLSVGYASHVAVKALDAAVTPATKSRLKLGITLYYAQIGLNLVWSPLFFGTQQPGLALIDSVLYAATTWYMTKVLHSPTKGKTTPFLLPYAAWLSYAAYLNAGIWWLN